MDVSYNPTVTSYEGPGQVFPNVQDEQHALVSELLNLDTLSSSSSSPPTYGSVNPPANNTAAQQASMSAAEFFMFSNSMVNLLA